MPFLSTAEESLFQLNSAQFDFNVEFEQLFFSIIPSTVFIVASLWRMVSQFQKPTVVNAPVFRLIKLGAILAYAGLELSLVIVMAVGSLQATRLFVAASTLKLVAASVMVFLSFVDHSKSRRPSVLLSSYVVLTLLLDAAQARTLFLLSDRGIEIAWSSIFVTALSLKCGILFLEAQGKSKWINWDQKEHSPEETSGIFSLGVFFWLNKIFLRGYRQILTIKDLYPLDSEMQGELLHQQFQRQMECSKLRGDRFGLLKALISTLKGRLLLPVLPRLAQLGFQICQPFFIENLVEYLGRPEGVEENIGYGFIGASVLIYSGIAISVALCWYFHHRTRIMTRAILVTEIYNKATQVHIGAGDNSAAVTLMSTDIERIIYGMRTLHDVWACVLQVAIAGCMAFRHLGPIFAVSMGVVIICTACLGYLLKFTGSAQRAWMLKVEKRVGMTATVIAGMRNLKLSGLSTAASDFLQQLRTEELVAGSTFRKITILAALFGFVPFFLSPALTFAFAQRQLDAARIFSSLSWLLLLTNPLGQIFQAIPQITAGLVCIGRIQTFLKSESNVDYRRLSNPGREGSEKAPTVHDTESRFSNLFIIRDGKFGWERDKPVLKDVNVEIPKSSLTMVVGPVGSGKSTFCKALLGELIYSEGSVELSERVHHVGFCEQTAFLFNGSIRENIVGYSLFDQDRYSEIIDATALSVDLTLLPQGDHTIIGSDGITLSGGQKQRVSLARALYLQADLLVLDDVFSGLDADTETHVFEEVFGPRGILAHRHSTVVLCTHSIRHLHTADHIIALGNETVIEKGSFKDLMESAGYVQSLGLTSSDSETSSQDKILEGEASNPKPRYGVIKPQSEISSLMSNADQARQMGDKTIYKKYVKAMGIPAAASALGFAVLWGFFTNFPTVWLNYWTEDIYSAYPRHSFAFYAGIYGVFQICAMVSLLLLGIVIFITSVNKVGANLHQDALWTLFRATLRFFTKTDTGVITNLFSQDLNLIDTELPTALLNTLFCVFQALGQAAVMLTSSPYLAISYPFLGVLLYILSKYYLCTSRQIRLLDLEAKSPLYTHFIDTLKGIATLRASGFLSKELEKNARLIDASQRPAYFLLMIQQWLNCVVDVVVMIMAVVLTTLAVQLRSHSGFTGASLVSLMQFGESLSGIVIFYTQLETSLGAIGRLKNFDETVMPEGNQDENVVPAEQWPHNGHIEFKGVSASYNIDERSEDKLDLAIKNVKLEIQPGEKVAICGRSGSGKSSLIALLLKLLDPTSETKSNIVIDDQALQYIDRTALRQRLIAIPQEPVFLPDGTTFYTNIDPFKVSTPTECQGVLEALNLWHFVTQRGGINASMSASTLSAGQRQLMSLSRALLRRRVLERSRSGNFQSPKGGILLLDEVSSSVDHETERLMQDVISSEFKHYTVVAVSHRLDMVMDFDRVVVMDTGEIVEVGKPRVLAEEEGSRFQMLAKAAAK
ncbi:putative ABC multidrug transporter [Lindgomyces ingoldianus]|uniref:ABC multidrug transporter n=1 Tax=Lindgomyces ingoldianus TaxID=673940 RepID=A0ACB6QWE6_9PLEO|nr:putative ABC multidrug transporter [Lindgomyces ingoldianus]KAF2470392.1 putative ABC multidrug transporter [Lindgomyces ingoldianus]